MRGTGLRNGVSGSAFPNRVWERVETGRLRVVANTRVAGVHRVYNMTVEGEHVYRVSCLGALTHNLNCKISKGKQRSDNHHIQTNKNKISTAAGGPYTPKFEALAKRRGITLESSTNKMGLPGHKGPHPKYNKAVWERMEAATKGLKGDKFNKAYDKELALIAKETGTPGMILNVLATGK
jgi:hypothetical protein